MHTVPDPPQDPPYMPTVYVGNLFFRKNAHLLHFKFEYLVASIFHYFPLRLDLPLNCQSGLL